MTMDDVVDVVARLAAERWADGELERQDVAWRHPADGRDLSAFSRGEGPGRTVRPVVRTVPPPGSSRPGSPTGCRSDAQARVAAPEGRSSERTSSRSRRPCANSASSPCARTPAARTCPSAGPTAPPRSWCWANDAPGPAGSASSTRGSRSHRQADEPARVAEAIERMALDHAVLTMVARDDLVDGGMAHVAACVEAIRVVARRPGSRRSSPTPRATTVVGVAVRRPTRRVEPQRRDRGPAATGGPAIGRVRPLARRARPGQGRRADHQDRVHGRPRGDRRRDRRVPRRHRRHRRRHRHDRQYLRPTSHHLPIARYAEPAEFVRWKQIGEALGIGHVEASPLTRSSYHARHAADAVRAGPPWPAERRGTCSARTGAGRSSRSRRSLRRRRRWRRRDRSRRPAAGHRLGADDDAVWGSFRGSGAEPYDTMVDHVTVGVRLHLPESSDAVQARPRAAAAVDRRQVPEVVAPAHVDVVARAAPGGRRSLRRGTSDAPRPWRTGDAAPTRRRRDRRPRDDGRRPRPAAAADRPARRTRRARGADDEGLDELDRWLVDRMRTGLADPALARYATWDRSRRGSSTPGRQPRQPGPPARRRRRRVARLAPAGARRDRPAPSAVAGRPPPRHAARTRSPIGGDDDRVAGPPGRRARRCARHRRLGRRRTQRHPGGPHRGPAALAAWATSGRWALVLSFAAYRQSLDTSLIVGSTIHADLHRYPGHALAGARRATRECRRSAISARPDGTSGRSSTRATRWGGASADEPWLDRVPALVRASPTGRRALGADRRHRTCRSTTRADGDVGRCGAARGVGGRPVDLTVEWTPTGVVPLTIRRRRRRRSTSDLVPIRRSWRAA